ncbi:MAG TPA: hypothetical protein VJA94_09980 [Candidatus Angelobacter sp.]
MNNTSGRDNFVSRITLEIKLDNFAAYGQVQRPDMYSGKYSRKIRRVDIQCDAFSLTQLRYFPKNNRRNAPGMIRKQALFGSAQSSFQSMNENVSVKIQHPT